MLIDSCTVKASGRMTLDWLAVNIPAKPAVEAPMAKAMTLYLSGLIPTALGGDLVLADGGPGPADPASARAG